ncbi:MAG: TIGR03936 family radical SAM-associated protein [Candidatus Nanopelagicales bacterium]
MARPQPDRVAEPVVQRMRLRYAKRGPLRFSSHRDFQRAFERAVRRAGVPIAFSAGFSPHPRISYANAAPTGIASEAEYLEIGLTHPVPPEQLRAALDAALPPGMDIIEAVVAHAPDFADRLQASIWQAELFDLSPSAVELAVAALLAAPSAEVTRMTKQGLRTFDARPALLGIELEGDQQPVASVILRLVVRHTIPAVRPDDILQALFSVGSLQTRTPPRVMRRSQGPLLDDARDVGDPLAADRV